MFKNSYLIYNFTTLKIKLLKKLIKPPKVLVQTPFKISEIQIKVVNIA
jgi:predicted AAA+ superfamily ATPase